MADVPVTWTKISNGTVEATGAGLLRTAGGALHVVWRRDDATTSSYQHATISPGGKLVGTGVVLSHWRGLTADPRLVKKGAGLRLVFSGQQDGSTSNPFSLGALYTATSSNGSA